MKLIIQFNFGTNWKVKHIQKFIVMHHITLELQHGLLNRNILFITSRHIKHCMQHWSVSRRTLFQKERENSIKFCLQKNIFFTHSNIIDKYILLRMKKLIRAILHMLMQKKIFHERSERKILFSKTLLRMRLKLKLIVYFKKMEKDNVIYPLL